MQKCHSGTNTGSFSGTMCSNGRGNLASKTTSKKCVSPFGNENLMGGQSDNYSSSERGFRMVVTSCERMEQSVAIRAPNRSTTLHGRVRDRLGRMDARKESSGFLEQTAQRNALQLQGNVRSTHGNTFLPAYNKREISTSSIRQYFYDRVPKSPWRGSEDTVRYREDSMVDRVSKQHPNIREIFSRTQQCGGRPTFKAKPVIRMEITYQALPMVEQHVGSPHSGPFRDTHQYTITTLQQQVLRSQVGGRRRISATELEIGEQLCKPTIPADTRRNRSHQTTRSSSNGHNSGVARTGVVPRAKTVINRKPSGTSRVTSHNVDSRPDTRTFEKPQMATDGLESVWRHHLEELNWPERARSQCTMSWAPSTLRTYDRQLRKMKTFCLTNQIPFPPSDSGTVAAFLCEVADSSTKPRSILRCTTAAMSALYQATGERNPADSVEIKRLITALEKSNTREPMQRSTVMPVRPFVKLFEEWGENANLSLKQMRLKAITLLSLAIMARPSDLAPKGVFFSTDGTNKPIILSTDQLVFHDNGSLSIQLFGIKNDTHRKGFVVTIPCATNTFVDPVDCLKTYIRKSAPMRELCESKPLFVSLKAPFTAVSAGTIADQLNAAIKLAGLGDRGYSAKSFRPTAATVAIASGCDPDIARKIGRWECPAVFYDHYVHSRTPKDFVNKLFQHD